MSISQVPNIYLEDLSRESLTCLVLPSKAPTSWKRCLSILLEDYQEVGCVFYSQVLPGDDTDSFYLLVAFLAVSLPGVRLRELHLKLGRIFPAANGRSVRHAIVQEGFPGELPGDQLIQAARTEGSLLYMRNSTAFQATLQGPASLMARSKKRAKTPLRAARQP